MLLIHPPHTRATEPPAGLALLAGVLRSGGHECRVSDLNLELIHHLLTEPLVSHDTWSKRAHANRLQHLRDLRSDRAYTNPDRYRRIVADLGRLVQNTGKHHGVTLTLTDLQDDSASPQSSAQLLHVAREYRNHFLFPWFAERLDILLAETGTTRVGFSLLYLSQALCTFAMLGYLRATHPRLTLVVGGGLVTTWLRNNPALGRRFSGLIDHLCAGPGETFLSSLTGGTIQEPARHVPLYSDLYQLPYLSPGFILPYGTATGCYWRRCSFCPETSEGNPYEPLPPETVTAELTQLVNSYQPRLIHFLDNALSPHQLSHLAANPPGADWYGFARFQRQFLDPNFCRRLRASGCLMLQLGLESGSDRVLAALEKGIDLHLVPQMLANLHRAGILTYVYLLFGTPAEGRHEAGQTLDFIATHAANISFLNLAIFNLPTRSHQSISLDLHPFSTGDLPLYANFSHPQGWDRKAVRHFLDTEFRRTPAIQEILRRDPPAFTSSHAPFFHHLYGTG